MKVNISILILYTLTLVACTPNESEQMSLLTCEDEAYLGLLDFSMTSSAFFPYPETLQTISMVDVAGNKVEFVSRINTKSDSRSFFPWDRTCTLDPTQTYIPHMDHQSYVIQLDNDALNLKLRVELTSSFILDQEAEPIELYDIMSMIVVTPIDTTAVNTSYSILTDIRNSSLTLGTPSYDTFELNGRSFTDVYTNESEMKDYTIYYNTTYGIVGIVSDNSNIQLAFDKFN